MAQQFVTPVGRIVWGHPCKSQVKTNYTTKQPVLKDGEKVLEWSCGIAFLKHEYEQFIKPYLEAEARTAYPNGVPRDFSWKTTDGDGVDDKGKPFNTREGYAGCVVVKFSTEAFPPNVFKLENGAYFQLTENQVKCGDYIRVKVNAKVHTNNSGGIYTNPEMYELVAEGVEIVTQNADPSEAFGGQAAQLPRGAMLAQPAPIQQHGMVAPQPQYGASPQQPAPQAAPMAQPQYQAPPAQAAPMQGMPPPAYDLLQGNAPPQQQPMGQQPMGQHPMGQHPMGQQPMGQQPMGQHPMGQQPMGQQPMQGMPPQYQAPPAQAAVPLQTQGYPQAGYATNVT